MPDLTKEQLYIILGIIAVILVGCIVGIYNKNSVDQPAPEVVSEQPKPVKTETVRSAIFVQISGAVEREGVYKLNKGDRLIDLVKISGVDPYADLDSVNLAEYLSDGQKIIIPRKSQTTSQAQQITVSRGKADNASKIININSADEKGLDALPGIGPVMAKKIIAYRMEKGRFLNIEQLKEVPGISQKKFDNLKAFISIN